METYSAEEAKKRYETLPQEVKNLLYSPQMSFVVQQISVKNKLHLDQTDVLNTEIGQLMLGFTDPKDFSDILIEALRIERGQADTIVQNINEMLLLPVREAMKKISAEHTATTTPSVSQPADITVPPAAVQNPPTMSEKSVVMPSSLVTAPKPAEAPSTPPTTLVSNASQSDVSVPLDMQINAPLAKPEITAPLHEADVILSEPTISMPKKVDIAAPAAAPANTVPNITAKVETPKPAPIYKADPYREPIE